MRRVLFATVLAIASPAAAQTCMIDFTIEVTQGVGSIPIGSLLPGSALFTASGQTIRQENGSTGHLAMGHMTIGDNITGQIWTVIITSRGQVADLIGIYANQVEGLSFAGVDFEGPMALTLFGAPGTRQTAHTPTTQAEWDDMNMRRAFSLHGFSDMLAGDVVALTAECR